MKNHDAAVFFDRDGTLTHADPACDAFLRDRIAFWTHRPYVPPTYEQAMTFLDRCGRPKARDWSEAAEKASLTRYYALQLRAAGAADDVEAHAAVLTDRLWLRDRVLYPEVKDTLAYFKRNGFRMGVISDTSPALRLTLRALGIDAYFDCFICSDEVGVMKPDPRMYQAALDALGVSAEQSIYVDDYDVEADGARDMGFLSFHLTRRQPPAGVWDIASLSDMVRYREEHR